MQTVQTFVGKKEKGCCENSVNSSVILWRPHKITKRGHRVLRCIKMANALLIPKMKSFRLHLALISAEKHVAYKRVS